MALQVSLDCNSVQGAEQDETRQEAHLARIDALPVVSTTYARILILLDQGFRLNNTMDCNILP